MIDLTVPGNLKFLADQIKNDIDSYCVWKYNDGPRSHLGASQIGQSCSRDLWYKFRWITHKIHTGQEYRLFQRGHFEEARFTSYLEGIGCTVRTLAKLLWFDTKTNTYIIDAYNINLIPSNKNFIDVTYDPYHLKKAEEAGVIYDKGKAQFRIEGCKGHFGGSLDAEIVLPDRYKFPEPLIFLGEYKTQGTQKFHELIKDGCQKKKYQHYCQQCTYAYKKGYKYGIYIVVNKNDDYLYVEVIKMDWDLGKEMIDRAKYIIFSEIPPNRISQSPGFYGCTYCDSKDVCWKDAAPLVNCRSCKRCHPIKNAEWSCERYGVVPKDFIPKACEEWKSIIGDN